MSDVRTPDDLQDTANDAIDHDPWWGDLESHPVVERVKAAGRKSVITPTRRAVRRATPASKPTSLGARVVTEITRSARNSHRFRRAVVVTGIAAIVLFGLTCSVGVIMLNNLVIRRSAELDSLDNSRKKLRTDNAKLSADNARLSAPPRVSALAQKRLGMIPSLKMPEFIFLDPDNNPTQPAGNGRRRRRAAAAAAARANVPTARYQAATGASASSTTPPATGTRSSTRAPLATSTVSTTTAPAPAPTGATQ